jgi:hypothetical protein
MSFTDQKPRVVTEKELKARWGGYSDGRMFRCYLCGHRFQLGDVWRWVYSPRKWHNFMVCEKCDGDDVLERWWKHMDDARTKYWHLFDKDL